MTKATHLDNKTGKQVVVERYEGGIIVVNNLSGKPIKSYDLKNKSKFYQRFKSLLVKPERTTR